MTESLINSAALYFRADAPQRVPILWLIRAIDFFSSQGIGLEYFDMDGAEDSRSDEVCDFAEHKSVLFEAVTKGLVERVGLYSNRNPNTPRSAWQAMASIEMELGMMFLGIEEARLPQHGLLLQSAYGMGGERLGVKYGISYKQLQSKGPDSYAAGILQGSLTDLKAWLTLEGEETRRITAWRNEKYGKRRYLSGLFRGAYPASLISLEHLAALLGRVDFGQIPGIITPLVENKLWTWELTNSEMMVVEELLRDSSLLVE